MITFAAVNILGILSNVLYIVAGILALGVIVFVHELGHFIGGRWAGIRVEAFSIGFGPILWRKKVGETEYRLSALLFGGYVKFTGMEGLEDKTTGTHTPPQQIPRGFYAVSPARRIVAAVLGPAMNLLLAFALFFVLWGTGRLVPEGQATTVIGRVAEKSGAEEAGLQAGDRLLSIAGRPVADWQDVLMGVALGGDAAEVQFERDGVVSTVTVHPKENPEVGAKIMGIEPAQRVQVAGTMKDSEAERMGLQTDDILLRLNGELILSGPSGWQENLRARAGQAIEITVLRGDQEVVLAGRMPEAVPAPEGSKEPPPPVLGFGMGYVSTTIYENPVEATVSCLSTVWRTLEALLVGRVKAKGLSGPVGIVRVVTISLAISFTAFLWWSAFISLNLAFINLLPIPVVDGGHIMFCLIEKFRGKPIRERTMAVVTNVFAVLLIGFFLYVTFNDVKRFLPTKETPSSQEEESSEPGKEPGEEQPADAEESPAEEQPDLP